MVHSDSYYMVRGIVRTAVGSLGLLALWFLIHLLATSVIATVVVLVGTLVAVGIHDRKEAREEAQRVEAQMVEVQNG